MGSDVAPQVPCTPRWAVRPRGTGALWAAVGRGGPRWIDVRAQVKIAAIRLRAANTWSRKREASRKTRQLDAAHESLRTTRSTCSSWRMTPRRRAWVRSWAGVWTGECWPREGTGETAGRRGAAAPEHGLADLSEVVKTVWFWGLTGLDDGGNCGEAAFTIFRATPPPPPSFRRRAACQSEAAEAVNVVG